MPRHPHLPTADRFFARVRAADLECIYCGTVLILASARHSENRSSPRSAGRGRHRRIPVKSATTDPRKARSWWDPLTGVVRCPACRRLMVLGIIAWPVNSGRALGIAEDYVPNDQQLAELRAMSGQGYWMGRAQRIRQMRLSQVNYTAKCTCALGGECLLHPRGPTGEST